MSRDPSAYPDPFNFVPERYLDPDTRDPSRLQFGFGRRYVTLQRTLKVFMH